MSWWVKVGVAVAALGVAAVLTAVPVRSVDGAATEVSQTATVVDGGCGEITLDATLESTGRAPLVDVWGLTRVEVTMVEPTITTARTQACTDDIVLTGGALVFDPDCDVPVEVNEDVDLLEPGEPEPRCGGDGWVLQPWAGPSGLDGVEAGGQSFTYAGDRLPLGAGTTTHDRWCAGSQQYVEQRWETLAGINVDGPTAEVVDGDLCVPTRP
ncbi:hypothetical protein [Demequina sp. NBRC 110057]|uniref:hypothetical protein n=1 Tax=Demequina sp. NBRC 110057 TaxID=1570346 RepID=UPI0009FC3F5E|nr:hypothetical protein [Demequina sp. NBRC 110057]